MKQVSHRGYLLVEVPDYAKGMRVVNSQNNMGQALFFSKEINFKLLWPEFKILPPGQWEIIGKGNEITEEVWGQILVKEDLYWEMSYRRYPEPGQELAFQEHIAETATESGHSLIKSHGMKPETTLILKLRNHE